MSIRELIASVARRLGPHGTTIVGVLLLVITAAFEWRGYVESHEALYFIGPHRVADPEFLATDLTWSRLPPTTFLYDHMIAPLWNVLGDLGIATLGRLVFWGLTAWSLAMLTRLMRLPPWAMVVGYALWLLAGQTLVQCGSPIEGFQPKALAYPLSYFALAFAMQGRYVRAGLAAGLATAFHIMVGGWACFAVFCSMVLSREVPRRKLLAFLAEAAPFVVPLVVAVGLFNWGESTAEQRALMDEIYVRFAAPHCCDPSRFMTPPRWLQNGAVFALALLLLYLRPRDRGGRMPAHFVLVLIGTFGAGVIAHVFGANWFLKLYPFQLANSIPYLFLFVLALAGFGADRPQRLAGKIAWVAALVVCAASTNPKLIVAELREMPGRLKLRDVQPDLALSYGNRPIPARLYEWIRKETPRDSVFITPHLGEFWICAERAQVASVRQPPLDVRIIEWKERLIALNGGEPFEERGYKIEESLDLNESRLTIPDLIRIRDTYGATHYYTERSRANLAPHQLFAIGRHHIYNLTTLP